jgi:OmpA-OmpF porin, OOP family
MNLHQMKKAAWIALGALVAMPASAQWYAGAGVGTSNVTGINGTGAVTATTNATITGFQNRNTWKLYGGYQFTPYWGIEAQYANLGKRNGLATFSGAVVGNAPLSANMSQWSVAGTGTLPLTDVFYLLAKLGASRNSTDNITATVSTVTLSTNSQDKTSIFGGLGGGFNINKNIGVRVEYENFGKFTANGGLVGASSVRADSWSISLKYLF